MSILLTYAQPVINNMPNPYITALQQQADNDCDSAYKLAMHLFGSPVPKGNEQPEVDADEGRKYMSLAARNGNHDARNFLSEALLTGNAGYEPSFENWFGQLYPLAQNDPKLAYQMGLILLNQWGYEEMKVAVPIRPDDAKKLLIMAAESTDKTTVQSALEVLIIGVQDKQWDIDLEALLEKNIEAGSTLIAIRYGWFLIPSDIREAIKDKSVTVNNQTHTLDIFLGNNMTYLGEYLTPNLDKAIQILGDVSQNNRVYNKMMTTILAETITCHVNRFMAGENAEQQPTAPKHPK